ncbi:MAG: hypothetical protein C4541_09175 [Candidatus Auribacter fodinae]|jgi:hypothetical protein|uniref:Uncharacterized protein n=1 Tax=Candidatus Auribacter fodinae TaxID=2093366 RepID=A0A3A4R8S2_9BACT|nr:MAG: hypothetical protein C4541_09175 [Candidatus Auribacter fodinae]
MGLVTRQYTYVPGRTIRSDEVNKNENTLYEEMNGNIEDINMKSATLTQRVFSDDVNPLVRDAEKYESFVSSGLVVADASSDGSAKVVISSGVAYTRYNDKLYRTLTNTETYTVSAEANGTYYLFIDYQGTFFDETDPDPGVGRQAVAQLTVNGFPGSPVVSVSDMRRMQLYDKPSHYITGCMLSYAGAYAISVSAGEVEIGNVFLQSAGGKSAIDITDSNNYFEGNISPVNSWCYVYAVRLGTSLSWDIQLSAQPPQYADTYGNTSGIKRYRQVDTNYYRCVGAVYRKSDGTLAQFFQNGNYVQYAEFRSVTAGSPTNANIPATGKLGYFQLYAQTLSGSVAEVYIRPAGSGGNYFTNQPNITNEKNWMYVICATNDSQQIDLTVNNNGSCLTVGYWMNIR